MRRYTLLNHRFYVYDESFNLSFVKEKDFIRISDEFIKKLELILKNRTFLEYSSREVIIGLSKCSTLLNSNDIQYLIQILTLNLSGENEFEKLISFFHSCLIRKKEVLHVDGSPSTGGLIHNFALTSKIPSKIFHEDFKENNVKLQDQFINDYYYVFKDVKMYWNEVGNIEEGFNYYGITIITPNMAKQLLDRMVEYIECDNSEAAEYFVGYDYDALKKLLNQSIVEKKYLIHFGI
jgi:hypothetical protein